MNGLTKNMTSNHPTKGGFYFIVQRIIYHPNPYTLARRLVNMVVKINKKPITVTDETASDKNIDWVYIGVSTAGYVGLFSLLDYACYTFFYIHPIPLIQYVTSFIMWLL